MCAVAICYPALLDFPLHIPFFPCFTATSLAALSSDESGGVEGIASLLRCLELYTAQPTPRPAARAIAATVGVVLCVISPLRRIAG